MDYLSEDVKNKMRRFYKSKDKRKVPGICIRTCSGFPCTTVQSYNPDWCYTFNRKSDIPKELLKDHFPCLSYSYFGGRFNFTEREEYAEKCRKIHRELMEKARKELGFDDRNPFI